MQPEDQEQKRGKLSHEINIDHLIETPKHEIAGIRYPSAGQ
jgi:hypothetical protein